MMISFLDAVLFWLGKYTPTFCISLSVLEEITSLSNLRQFECVRGDMVYKENFQIRQKPVQELNIIPSSSVCVYSFATVVFSPLLP